MAIAHASACAGWSSLGIGAPQTANTSSPTYFISVPRIDSTSSVDAVVVVVEHRPHRARGQALRQRGEPAEVAEQHGHVEALTFGRGLGPVLVDEALRDRLGNVLREERGHAPTLPRLAEVAEHDRAEESDDERDERVHEVGDDAVVEAPHDEHDVGEREQRV